MIIPIHQQPAEPWAMIESAGYASEAEWQRLLDLEARNAQEPIKDDGSVFHR